jgi:ribose transport system ATP-binding protein
MTEPELLVEMRGIEKVFGTVPVLSDVCFQLRPGEVHVLAGENGAGKSTLMKILSGFYPHYRGEIRLEGRPVRFRSTQDAGTKGITVIHQEMSLIGSMSVVDNLLLGQPLGSRFWLHRRREARRATECLRILSLQLNLERAVEEYPLPVRQMLEITKALARNARIVIMDEPTSALNGPEIETLFAVISDLKRRGCGVIYITHRMEEIYRIADRITVLRDGRNAGTEEIGSLPPAQLIQWMVGREISQQFPRRLPKPGSRRLSVHNLCLPDPSGTRKHSVEDVSFQVAAGEVLGIAGLEGSGKSELLNGLFGACGRGTTGTVLLDDQPLPMNRPSEAIAKGLALLTNDRKEKGLVSSLDLARNITLASLRAFSSWGWIRQEEEEETSRKFIDRLAIRSFSVRQEISTLSGGNQQKVLLARWLLTGPRVLLLDEPTRGVDVGAKHDIYQLINECTDQGVAVVLVTSELPELLALSDRILVLHRGRQTAELSRAEATAETVLRAAMGENRVP